MEGQTTLEFLNAAHGDAILLHWGDPPRLALIDGGPSGSFGLSLGPRLSEIRAERARSLADPLVIDLVCATHIDDDHIAGIVELLRDLRRKERDHLPPPYRVDRLWHNSFEDLISLTSSAASATKIAAELLEMAPEDAVLAASVNQGRDLRDLAHFLHVAGNQPFGKPITSGLSTTLFGLDITVVGPCREALDRLEKKWRETKRRHDPSVLAAGFTDRSIPNLSSICLIVNTGRGQALLTGDARGDQIIQGLEEAGLLAPGGVARMEVLQIPHHGSANNVDPVFFERVIADHYVISADGIAHPHPDGTVLEWLVNARGTDSCSIHLTNPVPAALKRLAELSVGRNMLVTARAQGASGVSLRLGSCP